MTKRSVFMRARIAVTTFWLRQFSCLVLVTTGLAAQGVAPPTRVSSSKLALDAERASEEWLNVDKTLVQDVFSKPPEIGRASCRERV